MGKKKESGCDVKSIRWHEPDNGTEFTVVMVRGDAPETGPLSDAGYGGRFVLFMSVDPGTETFAWKPRTFARKSGAENIKRFCSSMYFDGDSHSNFGWDDIEDGGYYGPEIYDE